MTLGDVAREILAQFNEQFARGTEWRFCGPHYVTYERGEWMLHPFGAFADERYSFKCETRVYGCRDLLGLLRALLTRKG